MALHDISYPFFFTRTIGAVVIFGPEKQQTPNNERRPRIGWAPNPFPFWCPPMRLVFLRASPPPYPCIKPILCPKNHYKLRNNPKYRREKPQKSTSNIDHYTKHLTNIFQYFISSCDGTCSRPPGSSMFVPSEHHLSPLRLGPDTPLLWFAAY